MTGRLPLGPEELGPTEGNELDDALEAIDALERTAADAPPGATVGFTDRVMSAIAREPSPAPTGFLLPLRRRGLLTGFAESVRQAWAAVGSGRPAFARAAALGYVLVVAIAGTSVVGAATFGAAGALGLLGPRETAKPTPSVVAPPPALPTDPAPTPSTAPEPSPTLDAVEPTDDRGGGGEAEPSDDHGGNSGSGGGGGGDGSSDSGDSGAHETDDHSGSDDSGGSDDGSSGGGSDSSATQTPRPTGTPKPTETPH